jgi:DNA (cytosine-5)-methyltransferase 1
MIKALDLFSGAGGFSLGLHQEGIQTIGAIEIDRFAAETYRHNFPDVPVYEDDLSTISDENVFNQFNGVDLIVGGPPCQGFSAAGPKQYGIIDDRNKLLMEVARFAKILQPKVCIIENVKGLLSGKLSKANYALELYIDEMKKSGYSVKYQVLQARDFGVPQWRERVFVIASKVKSESLIKGSFGGDVKPWVTVGEAILDLPLLDSGQGEAFFESYKTNTTCDYQELMRSNSIGIYNHVSMKHTPRLIERFKHIEQGQSLVHVPKEHGQRLRNGTTLDSNMRFKMNNQRLSPNKHSLAITASFQSNYVHPFQHRNLTAREGARIQSFPDDFIFCGPRTLMSKSLLKKENRLDELGLSQYNQIGNAVPPLLGKAVAQHALELM